jgi:cell division transport system ATP-binding protein
MIEFKNVTKTYSGNIIALDDICLDIEEKEFTFVTGPSGAGKSTLLRLLIREEKPSHGEIFFKEVDVVNLPKKLLCVYRQQIGVTFQDLKLLESRTARENIEFALEIVNKSCKEAKETAEYLLELVNLKDRSELLPCQLSGGEKQKIAIARALANGPKVLIADEPTGNLDPDSTKEIMEILKTINDVDTTVLVITHDYDVVERMNTRVIYLEKGKVVSDKKPTLKKTSKKGKEKTKKEEVKEEKKEEMTNNEGIDVLKLPKNLEEKLIGSKIDNLDKLMDLTEKQILEIGITEKQLETITNAIIDLNKLGD